MLSDVTFVGVVAGEFGAVESVERLVEVPPEVEVAQHWIGFEGGEFFVADKGLEVGLADEGGLVASLGEAFAEGGNRLVELGAEGVGAVLAWIHASDDRSSGGGTGGVGAVGAVEDRAALG